MRRKIKMIVDAVVIVIVVAIVASFISLADPILDHDDDIKRKKDNPILRSSMKDYMVRLNSAIESTESIIRQLAEEGKITKYFYTFFALAVHRLQCKVSKKRI